MCRKPNKTLYNFITAYAFLENLTMNFSPEMNFITKIKTLNIITQRSAFVQI